MRNPIAKMLTAFVISLMVRGAAATPDPTGWEIKSAELSQDAKTIRLVYENGKIATFKLAEGEVSFDAPNISQDRLSVAWDAEGYADASYTIPLSIYTLRNGKQTPHPDGCGRCCGDPGTGGPTGSRWMAGGKQIVLAYAFPNGMPYEHRTLIDVSTGECLAFVASDSNTGVLPKTLPAWAAALDSH